MGKQPVKPISEWKFEADDKLGLKGFAQRFFDYLIVDHHFASLVLAEPKCLRRVFPLKKHRRSS